MTPEMLLLGLGLFLLLLAAGGAIADAIDPYGEREDARRRNHARRVR